MVKTKIINRKITTMKLYNFKAQVLKYDLTCLINFIS